MRTYLRVSGPVAEFAARTFPQVHHLTHPSYIGHYLLFCDPWMSVPTMNRYGEELMAEIKTGIKLILYWLEIKIDGRPVWREQVLAPSKEEVKQLALKVVKLNPRWKRKGKVTYKSTVEDDTGFKIIK